MTVEQIYKQMDEKDKNFIIGADFEGIKDEINDAMGKLVDMVSFNRASDEDKLKIYATMTAAHDIFTEGINLINKVKL